MVSERRKVDDANPVILVADDDEAIRHVLRVQLTAHGYFVSEASTGAGVLQTVPWLRPDVILLDLGLPDVDGIEITRRVRVLTRASIIILSAHAAESDKIDALDAGADDYLTKPCQMADVLERLRTAHFRTTFEGSLFEAGDLSVDLNHGTVQIDHTPMQLTGVEYDLLRVLVLNAGRLLTHRRLAYEAWGLQIEDGGAQLLRTTIRTLRQRLEPDPARPRHIALEPGVGYRLRTET